MRWLMRLFHKRKLEAQLDAELRFHVEQRTADLISEGVEPAEARRRAMIEFGGLERAKEECRQARGTYFLESVLTDIRYALRTLRKSPGFTLVAILTLALGIGANTAIFSLINKVLLRTLPVANPHGLVLFSNSPVGGSDSGTETGHWIFFSNDNYEFFRKHDPSFEQLCAFQAGWSNWKVHVANPPAQAEMAHGRLVSGNYFSLLGLHPQVGRLFVPSDDAAGASPAVVLSYSYWTRQFHGDPSAIGKTVEINHADFMIIGVAPRTFSGVKYDRPDFWLPLTFQPQVMATESYAKDPRKYWLNIMGRLKSGVTLTQAQTVVNSELKRILATQAHAETPRQIASSYIKLAPGAWGISYFRFTYMNTLQVLAGIIGIVLLIVCANIANLLLARNSAREQEISIRMAVGATRPRLIRQLLTESVLLAIAGGSLGILAARWGAEIFAYLVIGARSVGKAPLDTRVFLVTAGVSVLAGILCGLVPALRSSRIDLASQANGSRFTRSRSRFASGLLVFQVAACVVLLIGAGLFLRTLQKLVDQHLGFDQDHILVAHINPEAAGYLPAQAPALYQALINRVESIPGVLSATVDSSEPFSGSSWTSNFSIEGEPSTRKMMVRKELVGPHYFETMGIPILLGRDIGPEDRPGTPLVTVINQKMAREYFPGENPVGRRFSLGAPFNSKEAMTVVGVAADARYYSLRDPIPPMEFCAAFQVPKPSSHNSAFAGEVEIRVRGNPDAIARDVRAAFAQVSAGLPVTKIDALTQEVSNSVRQNRSYAELSTAFGTIALLLACIGLYGTMAYRVSRRTHEIAMRIALGAQRSEVLWMVIKDSLQLVLVGLGIGVPIALAATRIIASQLFRVSATDPTTFITVSLVIFAVALLASWIPARRAARVDPVVALRQE